MGLISEKPTDEEWEAARAAFLAFHDAELSLIAPANWADQHHVVHDAWLEVARAARGVTGDGPAAE